MILSKLVGVSMAVAMLGAAAQSAPQMEPVSLLTSPQPDLFGGYGVSVAISGGTLAVGDIGATRTFARQGVIDVYTDTGGGWKFAAELVASDAQAQMALGEVLDMQEGRIVVGAPYDNDLGAFSGAVYVFEGSGANWSQVAKLTANDGNLTDQFGWSVALDGDALLIGARGKENGGAAYLFERIGGVWQETRKFVNGTTTTSISFGVSVALEGDTAIVGSLYGGTNNAGRAFVYRRTANTWAQEQVLSSAVVAISSEFGASVALRGNRALIGAPSDDYMGFLSSGSAFVFERTGTTWASIAQLGLAGPGNADRFGFVAWNGDRALVSANAGVHTLFAEVGPNWIEVDNLYEDGVAACDGPNFAVGALQGNDGVHGTVGVVSTFVSQAPSIGVALCNGDFAGAACPCGNTSVAGSGAGCAQYLGGVGGQLTASGSSSVVEREIVLLARQLPAQVPTLVISGLQVVGGPTGFTYGDGVRCVGGPLRRYTAGVSNNVGVFASTADWVGFNAWGAGLTAHFQVLYRVASPSACGNGLNLTNALAITLTP